MPICSACVRISSRPNAVTITICGMCLQPSFALDDAARLQAVHARHVPVHQDQPIRILRIGGRHFAASLPRRTKPHSARKREAPQRIAENLARLRIVVDDEHPDARQVGNEALALLLPLRCRTRR